METDEKSGGKSTEIYRVVDDLFERNYKPGMSEFSFHRKDISALAAELGVGTAANVPDIAYHFNFRRTDRSVLMRRTESRKKRWYILPAKGGYKFGLDQWPIEPTPDFVRTKVPNATPEIIASNALTDEQAVLARVKYNRLIDLFLGITAYPLQSHVRTKVDGVQVEIDELYLGIGESGEQFVVGVEAKVKDALAPYQIRNCFNACKAKFSRLTPKAVGVVWNQSDDFIAMFELTIGRGHRVLRERERHYQIVKAADISDKELRAMAKASK